MYYGRSTNVNKNPYNLSDMYEDYIKDIEPTSPYYVTRKQYIDINSKYLKHLGQELLDGKEIKLVHLNSTLMISKRPIDFIRKKKVPIDWKTTQELGVKVANFNKHSRGYIYKFKWNKSYVKVININYYNLLMCRTLKRTLAKLIKEGKVDYYK